MLLVGFSQVRRLWKRAFGEGVEQESPELLVSLRLLRKVLER